MENVFLCGMTTVVCGVGTGLFYLAAKDIGKAFPKKIYRMMVLCLLILTGILRWRYAQDITFILKCISLTMVLFVCAWTDYLKYQILNKVLLIACVMRAVWFIIDFLVFEDTEFTFIIISAVTAAGMLSICALLCKLVSQGGVGYGDIKLLAVVGIYTGVDMAIGIMIDTFFLMFVICVAMLLIKKVDRKTMIPFAPFLTMGTVLYMFLTGI